MGNVSKRLFDAVREGRLERVSELINTYGLSYSPDWQQGYELLRIAVMNDHSEVAKLLLTRGAKVNKENTDWRGTPLQHAARYGKLEIVKMLLSYGVDVEARHQYGRTALHIASDWGHKEIVKVLLEHGAEVDSKTDSGFTPLHRAAERGDLEVVETLLKSGADIDTRDKYGSTALHIASLNGYKEVVKVLLEHGAEVDSKTNNGSAPLYRAALRGYLEVVETLLKFGADINITTVDNHTPLDIAGDRPTAELLRRHIVQLNTANLYLNVRNLQSMEHFIDEFSTFRVQCGIEISAMKNEKFKKSNVSYYDVLTKTDLLSAYIRNENIAEALKSEEYRTTFPIYADMLKSNLRKAMERKYLLEQVHPISHPFDKLPCECVEEIFTYLNNKDITAFIVAYKPLWSRGELIL